MSFFHCPKNPYITPVTCGSTYSRALEIPNNPASHYCLSCGEGKKYIKVYKTTNENLNNTGICHCCGEEKAIYRILGISDKDVKEHKFCYNCRLHIQDVSKAGLSYKDTRQTIRNHRNEHGISSDKIDWGKWKMEHGMTQETEQIMEQIIERNVKTETSITNNTNSNTKKKAKERRKRVNKIDICRCCGKLIGIRKAGRCKFCTGKMEDAIAHGWTEEQAEIIIGSNAQFVNNKTGMAAKKLRWPWVEMSYGEWTLSKDYDTVTVTDKEINDLGAKLVASKQMADKFVDEVRKISSDTATACGPQAGTNTTDDLLNTKPTLSDEIKNDNGLSLSEIQEFLNPDSKYSINGNIIIEDAPSLSPYPDIVVTIKHDEYPEIYDKVIKYSTDQFRTPAMQVLYWLKRSN